MVKMSATEQKAVNGGYEYHCYCDYNRVFHTWFTYNIHIMFCTYARKRSGPKG